MERHNNRALGTRKELEAADYLTGQGVHILEHSFRYRQGEIDLIGREGRTLLFIEVKYRNSGRSGSAAEAVTPKKQSVIRSVAQYYLFSRRIPQDTPVRFDVVAIDQKSIRWITDAF